MSPHTGRNAEVSRRLSLSGVADPVAAGRDFTRRTLAEWGWPPVAEHPSTRVAQDVTLVVSELLSNAALHAHGPVDLVLSVCGQAVLRIEVADDSDIVPAPRPAGRPMVPGGHGLRIVDQISAAWGVVPRAEGKTVWSEIRP